MGPCLFCNVFPFPVGWAQLIGDWYENRQGAPNTIIFLIFRQYYWCTDAPCANRSGRRIRKKILLAHCAWSALPIGGGGHRGGLGAPIYWRTEAHLRQYIGTPMFPAPIVLVLVLYCMPGFFSSRPNWDLLTPYPTGECVPPSVPGGDTLAGEGVGGVPIRVDRHYGTLGIMLQVLHRLLADRT